MFNPRVFLPLVWVNCATKEHLRKMFGATVLYIIYRLHADNFAYPLSRSNIRLFYYYGMTGPLAEDSEYCKEFLAIRRAISLNETFVFFSVEITTGETRHIQEIYIVGQICEKIVHFMIKVSNGAKIRNRYNQVPHLTQDTNGKVTNSQKTPQTRAKRSALSQQVTKKHI